MNPNEPTLLRRALGANAAFSAFTGLLLLVAPGTIEAATGLGPVPALRALGGGLLLFALVVGSEARRARPRPRVALLISAADVLWVAGSTGLLAGTGAALPATGRWTVATVAAIVLLFATLQLAGRTRPGEAARRAA